jgi:hypothetical protein
VHCHEELDDLSTLSLPAQLRVFRGLLRTPGFPHCLLVFALAEATINAFSAFLDEQLRHIFLPSTIGAIGVWFILAGMASSALFSVVVDRTHMYKRVTLLVFAGTVASLVAFTFLSAHADEADVDPAGGVGVGGHWPIYAAIVAVGFWLGPLQPLAVEAAAEVSYPLAEELSATLLQLTANVASATLVPLCAMLKGADGSMTAPNLLVIAMVAVVAVLFTQWPERLLRYDAEVKHHRQHAMPAAFRAVAQELETPRHIHHHAHHIHSHEDNEAMLRARKIARREGEREARRARKRAQSSVAAR